MSGYAAGRPGGLVGQMTATGQGGVNALMDAGRYGAIEQRGGWYGWC